MPRRLSGSAAATTSDPCSTGPPEPLRNAATVFMGCTVAERPTRWSGRPTSLTDEVVEPHECQGQMSTPLIIDQGVNLVDDDSAHVLEPPTTTLGGQQDEERLRSRHEQMRRAATHLLSFSDRRVDRRVPPSAPPCGCAAEILPGQRPVPPTRPAVSPNFC